MKGLIFFFIGFSGGALSGFFLLRFLLPPLISRAIGVRENYNKLKTELEDVRNKIRNKNLKREELIDDIDNYFEEHS